MHAMQATLSRDKANYTQDWGDHGVALCKMSRQVAVDAGCWASEEAPITQNYTSCICWLMTEIPELESHSSGLRCLHPCKKYKHHKKRRHFNPNKPAFGIFVCTGRRSISLKGLKEVVQGHQAQNRKCNQKFFFFFLKKAGLWAEKKKSYSLFCSMA